MAKHAPQTGVLGVSGYAGMELARLLLHHPRLISREPVFFGRDSEPMPLTDLHPQLAGNNGSGSLLVEPFSWERVKERGVELIFMATPHEQSRSWVPEALSHGLRVIDLSAAWRLQHSRNRAIYNFEDADESAAGQVQASSIYGLPELHREQIRTARVVANPGCYATSVILALKPLVSAGWVDLERGIVCDSKSGVSGAGKAPTPNTHFMHAADNLSAYAVFGHRHMGEITEQLGISEEEIIFTPHLLPIPRGILSTIYLTFREKKHAAEVESLFREFYAQSPMVRIFGSKTAAGGSKASAEGSKTAAQSKGGGHGSEILPQIQHSVRTNYCDIGFRLAKDGRRCIVVSCLDNLLKGAAGQAVENMNLMYGWDEAEGLA
ncbi:MAG TPA: N-acetyl-gamma-glutamyl-phosphate reductase [Acidobacteriaceae bacterium]|nr:N-acetyl-gamma-glutamyl-phosphate reductase [Acidobacteriaceae bacterium]